MKLTRVSMVVALALIGGLACTGAIGDGSGEPGAGSGAGAPDVAGSKPATPTGNGPTSTPAAAGASGFRCDLAAVPPVQAWRKLTTAQYRNTLRDLLTFALRDQNAAGSAINGLAGSLARLPDDERQILPQDLHGSFRRLDQDVEQIHVDSTYEIALGAGAALSAKLGTIAGVCATDTNPGNDDDCVTTFVQSFGERALRRPLTPAEVTFYKGFYGSTGIDAAGFADVIAAFLTAPQFLYHIEHGEAAVAGKSNVFALTAYELANRLSYQFWDTMPDAELWAAAKSGALKTADGFAKQVDRLFADPRARATVDGFYRDWLKLDDLKPLDARVGEPVFKAFAADDLPKGTLRANMIDDALGMARYYTWDRPSAAGTFDDLLTSNLSFAKGADLAKIYGLPAWSGTGDPPAFAPDARPGLLTRAAFLATGSANTRPVMKGVFMRETILCDDIPPPPDNANAVAPDLDPKLSTRQVVEALTETKGTACAGCHAIMINPLGYATENFDALGRPRADQRLFSDKGLEAGRAPVDTRSVPQVVLGDMTPSNNAADLMRLVGKSGKAHACLARNYFRFTFARWEDSAADGCVLERLRKTLTDKGGSLRAMLREVALAPDFQARRF